MQLPIDSLRKGDLTNLLGFRSKKPNAFTRAEIQRRYRLRNSGRTLSVLLKPDLAACFIYIRTQWGMKSDREVMEAAVRFLTVCTRKGLTKLPQTLDD